MALEGPSTLLLPYFQNYRVSRLLMYSTEDPWQHQEEQTQTFIVCLLITHKNWRGSLAALILSPPQLHSRHKFPYSVGITQYQPRAGGEIFFARTQDNRHIFHWLENIGINPLIGIWPWPFEHKCDKWQGLGVIVCLLITHKNWRGESCSLDPAPPP